MRGVIHDVQSKRLQGWVLFDWLATFGADSRKKLQEVGLSFILAHASRNTQRFLLAMANVAMAGRAPNLQSAPQVWDLFLDGTIVPYTGKIFPLESWQEAVEESVKTGRGGKVLLEG
jgi:hypothetical protein